MEENIHDITTKTRQRKIIMTYTDKYYVEGSFNLRKPRSNNMHTFFYSNISEFSGNLEGILHEVTYKTTIHNIHKLGLKEKSFRFPDVSMLGHGCCVSQYPQFYNSV